VLIDETVWFWCAGYEPNCIMPAL